MKNHRPPPEQLERTRVNQMDSWCRYDPLYCSIQVLVETVFLIVGYCAVLFLTGGDVPGPLQILKFLLMFVVASMGARMLSDDLGNKLTFAAVSGVGSKIVTVLAPRFVGW